MGFILTSDLLNVIQNSINISNIQSVYNYILDQILTKYYPTYGLLFIPQPRAMVLPAIQLTSTATPMSGISTFYAVSALKIAQGTPIA